jgi:hypothetical protein
MSEPAAQRIDEKDCKSLTRCCFKTIEYGHDEKGEKTCTIRNIKYQCPLQGLPNGGKKDYRYVEEDCKSLTEPLAGVKGLPLGARVLHCSTEPLAPLVAIYCEQHQTKPCVYFSVRSQKTCGKLTRNANSKCAEHSRSLGVDQCRYEGCERRTFSKIQLCHEHGMIERNIVNSKRFQYIVSGTHQEKVKKIYDYCVENPNPRHNEIKAILSMGREL